MCLIFAFQETTQHQSPASNGSLDSFFGSPEKSKELARNDALGNTLFPGNAEGGLNLNEKGKMKNTPAVNDIASKPVSLCLNLVTYLISMPILL